MVERAIAEIDSEGAGVLVLLRDFEPDALSQRFSTETPKPPEQDTRALRVIGIGSQILRQLGVRRMVVLSSHAPQKLVAVEGFDLVIEGWRGFKS
jgi:3,4-dihydroxy 2-butanone 4-phosphate synthase/GTP cyclohydrolase II